MIKRLFLGVLCALILASMMLAHLYFRPIDLDHEKAIPFSVSSGESIRAIAKRLKTKGYIGWADGFVWLSRVNGSDRKLKAGRFIFRSHYIPRDILNCLTNAPPGTDLKLTFPEGLNRWQIADKLSKKGWNRRLLLTLIAREEMEGELFPDTYRLNPEMSESDVLTLMRRRFKQVWQPILDAHPKRPQLTSRQLLILASMVEKETVFAAEAPTIAQVFLNRLDKKMRLQSDPTYVYSAERYGKKPTRADRLQKNNPYNTDVIAGLPPGPIANPGRNAMLAAMGPNRSKHARKWLYFVAKRDGSGQHHFSNSYTEHKRAIHRYLKPKKNKKAKSAKQRTK